MVSEECVKTILTEHDRLDAAADALIREANEAGGRDNITVVLFRLEELGGDAAGEETVVGVSVPRDALATRTEESDGVGATAVAVAPPPTRAGARPTSPVAPRGTRRLRPRPPETVHRGRRFATPIAAFLATVIVVGLILAGGYLASRQLYFVGTNAQGIVTIYRGLPYNLPFGVPLYETYYVSGVPASVVPAARRTQLMNNNLRSQSDATSLVMDLEQGRISP
jgi:protein phosphatase